jgi:predicted transport protein
MAVCMTGWTCPKCQRKFARPNQRHACGTGDRDQVLRNRPPELVKLYATLEKYVRSLGSVEFVTRDRYVLFRSTRIFADLVVMTDALRLAIHLPRQVEHELFFKIVADRKHVSHVAKLRTPADLKAMQPLLREAYDYSISF